jgi:hypothetical protein
LQLLFFAHSDPQNPNDLSQWEPLFTPDCPALSGERCEACERMDRKHGHLNKVAWWTGKFTEEMFRNGSLEAEAAREWGYIAGLWHDIGKFAPTWQNYLRSPLRRTSSRSVRRLQPAKVVRLSHRKPPRFTAWRLFARNRKP